MAWFSPLNYHFPNTLIYENGHSGCELRLFQIQIRMDLTRWLSSLSRPLLCLADPGQRVIIVVNAGSPTEGINHDNTLWTVHLSLNSLICIFFKKICLNLFSTMSLTSWSKKIWDALDFTIPFIQKRLRWWGAEHNRCYIIFIGRIFIHLFCSLGPWRHIHIICTTYAAFIVYESDFTFLKPKNLSILLVN